MAGDLPRFSDVERQVLTLFGEGHTAKSIAGVTGLSVNAVNERLREARRKTGVGSSRELARLLRNKGDPEDRAKKIGVESARMGGEERASAPDHRVGYASRGPFAMSALTLALSAVAAFAGSRSHVPGVASEVPHVVATVPAAASRIAPGPFTLSVTFDRPMRPNSYSFVTTSVAPYPDCDPLPRQSDDGRTFSLRCTGRAGNRYSIGFNGGQFRNFVATDGAPAAPAVLTFYVR